MTLDPGRVQAVFLAVIERETRAERAAVLDRECAADDELRRRVEALLVAHDKPDRPLGRPFIARGEPGAAIHVQPADGDRADEGNTPPSDPEHTR